MLGMVMLKRVMTWLRLSFRPIVHPADVISFLNFSMSLLWMLTLMQWGLTNTLASVWCGTPLAVNRLHVCHCSEPSSERGQFCPILEWQEHGRFKNVRIKVCMYEKVNWNVCGLSFGIVSPTVFVFQYLRRIVVCFSDIFWRYYDRCQSASSVKKYETVAFKNEGRSNIVPIGWYLTYLNKVLNDLPTHRSRSNIKWGTIFRCKQYVLYKVCTKAITSAISWSLKSGNAGIEPSPYWMASTKSSASSS